MISRITYLVVLFALALACRWFVDYFSIALPAPLIGLVILLFALYILKGVPESLVWSSRLLLRYLSLFFIPVTVGVIAFKSQLSVHWQIITFTLITSTVLSLLLTALVAKKMLAKSS